MPSHLGRAARCSSTFNAVPRATVRAPYPKDVRQQSAGPTSSSHPLSSNVVYSSFLILLSLFCFSAALFPPWRPSHLCTDGVHSGIVSLGLQYLLKLALFHNSTFKRTFHLCGTIYDVVYLLHGYCLSRIIPPVVFIICHKEDYVVLGISTSTQ